MAEEEEEAERKIQVGSLEHKDDGGGKTSPREQQILFFF